jgi:hypothetical protein
MHMIKDSQPITYWQTNLTVFVSDVADIESTTTVNTPLSHADVPQLLKAQLDNLVRPTDMSDSDFTAFLWYAVNFSLHAQKLWHKDDQGWHKLVTTQSAQLTVLRTTHNDLAHKGFYAAAALISKQFWGPMMRTDIT